MAGRLVILSGPSCVGKSPLDRALGRFHPELRSQLRSLVLYTSRSPRPGEVDGRDYHFRIQGQIESLRDNPRYVVLDVRGDKQAVDLDELRSLLDRGDVFFEGNPFVGSMLASDELVRGVPKLSVFLAPLSREEILELREPARNLSLPDCVTEIMRRKLLRRTKRQKTELSAADLATIERRASSAYGEMKLAWRFQHVIASHDGEDSDNWEAFSYPLGDARHALNCFVSLLRGESPRAAERWDEDLLP
jgi:guanylate kinase